MQVVLLNKWLCKHGLKRVSSKQSSVMHVHYLKTFSSTNNK